MRRLQYQQVCRPWIASIGVPEKHSHILKNDTVELKQTSNNHGTTASEH